MPGFHALFVITPGLTSAPCAGVIPGDVLVPFALCPCRQCYEVIRAELLEHLIEGNLIEPLLVVESLSAQSNCKDGRWDFLNSCARG